MKVWIELGITVVAVIFFVWWMLSRTLKDVDRTIEETQDSKEENDV